MTIESLNKSLELSIRNAVNILAWRGKVKTGQRFPDLRTVDERMSWYRLRVKLILGDK